MDMGMYLCLLGSFGEQELEESSPLVLLVVFLLVGGFRSPHHSHFHGWGINNDNFVGPGICYSDDGDLLLRMEVVVPKNC